jgi:phage terminase Nu1 subunit (DNA packaging protein)
MKIEFHKVYSFADDVPVNGKELARTMRVSTRTVSKWKERGYVFEFGRMTTPGHCKEWLRHRALNVGDGASRRKLALDQML